MSVLFFSYMNMLLGILFGCLSLVICFYVRYKQNKCTMIVDGCRIRNRYYSYEINERIYQRRVLFFFPGNISHVRVKYNQLNPKDSYVIGYWMRYYTLYNLCYWVSMILITFGVVVYEINNFLK